MRRPEENHTRALLSPFTVPRGVGLNPCPESIPRPAPSVGFKDTAPASSTARPRACQPAGAIFTPSEITVWTWSSVVRTRTVGPAPETTAACPAARSPAISAAVAGMAGAR